MSLDASSFKERRHALRRELAGLSRRLGELARSTLLNHPHARDVIAPLPALDLSFHIEFSGALRSSESNAENVADILEQHIDDAVLAASAFRPGRVYCHFCQGVECGHAAPTDAKHVFRGYSQTGVPLWAPLLDLALERGDDRVEHLAAERGTAILMATDREELFRDLLPSFKSNERHYDIRGQIMLGYFHSSTGPGSEKFAVSLQFVRSTTRSGTIRLGMNALGRFPEGRDVEDSILHHESWPFVDLFYSTRRRLNEINQRLRTVPKNERRHAADDETRRLLHDLTLGINRHYRREGWRTEHAIKRAGEKTRPTGMARQDLLSARFDRVFVDRKEATFVVLGGKGRVHVFSPNGRHVTSLHLDRRELETRLAQKRWESAPREEIKLLLVQARALMEQSAEGESIRPSVPPGSIQVAPPKV